MILISLNGGLGNQLFQYALGRRLSYERKVPLRFDLSALQAPHSIRQYKLSHFQIHGQPASAEESCQFYARPTLNLLERILSSRQKIPLRYRQRIVTEKVFTFDENILRVPAPVCLQGYWQTDKYFMSIRETLQNDLRLTDPLDPVNQRMLASIQARKSVSVHIRRGDFVSNPEANQAHGVLSLSYYEAAFKRMKQMTAAPYFYIFSDDPDWANRNFGNLENTSIVNQNDPVHDYLDFSLMTDCRHHITANSSFSWWAAWLSKRTDKIVIAPKQWYQTDQDTRDLLPEEWIKI